MSLLSRFLMFGVLSTTGCSLFFSLLSNRAQCTESACSEDGRTSLFCNQGKLFVLDCAEANSFCDERNSECAPVCGDGSVNLIADERCDPRDDTSCNLVCQPLALCGDGLTLAPHEECDDSNIQNGDGCDHRCRLEPQEEAVFLNEPPFNDGSPCETNQAVDKFANGPFTKDTLLEASFSQLGDEDIFAIQNDSDELVSLQLDLPNLSVGVDMILCSEDGEFITFTNKSTLNIELPGNTTQYVHLVGRGNNSVGGFFNLLIDFDHKPFNCGDGVVGFGEDCDNNGEFCTDSCRHIPTCGDNFLDFEEECDDGNGRNGDDCDANCVLEGVEHETDTILEGPFEVDTVLFGRIEPLNKQPPPGEEPTGRDLFLLENTSNTPQVVRVDVFQATEGVGFPCRGLRAGLELQDASGAPLDRSSARVNRQDPSSFLDFNDARSDFCGTLTFSMAPDETRRVLILGEEIFPGDFDALEDVGYLIKIDFTECGDGELETATEECEPPNSATCDAACQRVPVCGDGLLDFPQEQCDDGNILEGDTCPANCLLIAGVVNEQESNELLAFAALITSDTLFLATIDNVFDQDRFLVQNLSGAPLTVLIEVFDPELGVGQPCTLQNTSIRLALLLGQGPPSLDPCPDALQELLPNTSVDVTLSATSNNPFFHSFHGMYLVRVSFTECGNNLLEQREECDPPGSALCDAACQRVPICGDDFTDFPETCDDGNILDGDACPADCASLALFNETEPNEDGSPSVGASSSGNDFSIINADGPISEDIVVVASIDPVGDEDVFAVTNPSANFVSVRLDTFDPLLGLGVSCNPFLNGGIDTALRVRDGSGEFIPFVEDVERAPGDTCDSLIFFLEPGQTLFVQVLESGDNALIGGYLLQVSFTSGICGDGILFTFQDLGEECDDGNNINGDGCQANCTLEGPPDCGDGVINGLEECDDGNIINGDGCEINCTLTP